MSTQLKALDEITNLAIEDPFIRTALVGCNLRRRLTPKFKEPDLLISTSKALGSVENTRIHSLWSDLIKRDRHISSDLDEVRIRNSLVPSLSDPNSSYLAARYLLHLVRLRIRVPTGHRTMVQDVFARLYAELWDFYQVIAERNPSIIEWSNFNSCIVHFGQPVTYNYMASVGGPARTLTQNIHKTRSSVEKLLMPPSIEYEVTDGTMMITRISNWKLDDWSCYSLCFSFLQEISGSEDPYTQLSFIRGMADSIRSELKLTVFGNEAFVAYCQLLHMSFFPGFNSSKKLHAALPDRWTQRSSFRSGTWQRFSFWAKLLMCLLCNSKNMHEKAILTCLIARYISISRYCKIAMWHAVEDIPQPLFSYLRLQVQELSNHFGKMIEESERVISDRFFSDRYLVRLRINKELYDIYYLTVEIHALFDSMLKMSMCQDIAVDVLVIDRNMALCHRLTGGRPYDETGHYPILAGFDPSGKPLYVAQHVHPQHFFVTCIANGDSVAQTKKAKGKLTGITEFSVLCLRFDPSDIQEHYPTSSAPNDAMDPTGPLHWLQFWPNKDPEFPNLNELEIGTELRQFSELLNIFSQSTNRADSKQMCTKRFYEAINEVPPDNRYFRRSLQSGRSKSSSADDEDDIKMSDSSGSPGYDLHSDSEDLGDAQDGQLSQSPHAPCSTPDGSFAHTIYVDAPGEPPESTAARGNLGVRIEEGGSEVEKLREELRRTQEELQRTQELVARLRGKKSANIGP